jgi:hypothetical protein
MISCINKVSKYFEVRLQENEFMREKSKPICKVAIHQIKETSLIIDFLKELRSDALQ